MQFRINRLQHVGIPVTDIEKSTDFYTRLGFQNVMEKSFEFKGSKGLVRMMKRDDTIVEIYQLPEEDLHGIKNRADGRIDHIAFDVDDIGEAFRELSAAGFIMLEPKPVFLPFWNHGCRYFNIAGPNGERIEFNQILKEPV